MNNYFCYHLHSMLSNAVTNIDSVTRFDEYVDKAKECGMKALAFTEHGSVMEWVHKKDAIEAAGMKYVHAVEAYLTFTLDEKIRDNYHIVLIARNYDGVRELNKMISKSFNRNDNHFFYTPRISFDELCKASDNILVTTACIAGVFGKGSYEERSKFLDFMSQNKDRCFLEIGQHVNQCQAEYNKKMADISKRTGIPLIAGTDTHALNSEHAEGRLILQRAKHIRFAGEDDWNLEFNTYDDLVKHYEQQGALPKEVYLSAIEETNVLADMIEPFELDKHTKYPHIYDNPEETFYKKIKEAEETHPYALKNHTREELDKVIDEEFEVYKATKSIDFMLMQTYLREWEKKHGIQCGYGRGSVSGSMIAYILGITQMDSMRFHLNFFRFMNPSRVTNADIDTDYSGKDRDTVKTFLLRDKMGLANINSAEIITFNTIQTKGAVRDVGRALGMPLKEVDEISKKCSDDEAPDALRKKYKELFKYVDIVAGTIVSVGTHPSGVLISDLPLDETVGLCSISTTPYPVSMLNMKELDELMYVKLDILGLDNIGIINDTCKDVGIERLNPDNVDLDDEDVWKSIRDDTTLIFQWESPSAQQYMKKLFSDRTIEIAKKHNKDFSYIKWMSFGNGLIRPACASFRDSVANGVFYDNGFKELNEFLAPEAGRIAMQETIMQFLVKFCGYSQAESDTVRRAIAKKKGTEQLLPEIERRFIEYCPQHYDITPEKCAEVIKPFIQVILDASAYAFSWNHSDAYSMVGYICGYLRYYYPIEFLTSALNIFEDDVDKTGAIIKYASRHGIKISMPKWGFSKGNYTYHKDLNVISKGLTSVKYMSEGVANELYAVASSHEFEYFSDVLSAIGATSVDSRQLDILIKIDFFREFGNQRELLYIADLYNNMFKKGNAKQIKKSAVEGTIIDDIVRKYSVGTTKSGNESKSYVLLDIGSILHESEKRIKNAHFEDLSIVEKAKNFNKFMGYNGLVTGKEEDRKKLSIMNVYALKRKKDGKQFGYSVITKSIGSGKESRFTVFNKVYKDDPIKKDDIIYLKGWHRDNGYFTLDEYEKIS